MCLCVFIAIVVMIGGTKRGRSRLSKLCSPSAVCHRCQQWFCLSLAAFASLGNLVPREGRPTRESGNSNVSFPGVMCFV